MQRAMLVLLVAAVCPSIAGAQDVASTVTVRVEPEVVEVAAEAEAVPDDGAGAEPVVDPPLPSTPPQAFLLHGFRLGYMYTFDVDTPLDSRRPRGSTYAEQYDVRSPHSFLFGYEVAWRMIGHEWLNVLLIGNVSIAGVEQSRFYPSGNLLFGFELVSSGIGDVQVGIGASFTPTKDEPVHLVTAIGIAPLIGSFYLPLHVFFVPDVDGHHRVGVTIGANFY